LRNAVLRRVDAVGFTLIELMVVLALLGLFASAILLTLPRLDGGARQEAERLAARAKLAQDEALVLGRPVALVLDGAGYGFERRVGFEWRAIAEQPFRRQTWDAGVRPDFAGAGSLRVTFDPFGAGEPAAVLLREGREAYRVRFEPSGARVEAAGGR